MFCFSDERLQMLIEAGANVDVKASLGWTPLHEASQNNHTDVVKVGAISECSASLINDDRC